MRDKKDIFTKNIEIFFCFIYVIHNKVIVEPTKLEKKIMLQFISHKNYKYEFFLYKNQSQSHKSRENNLIKTSFYFFHYFFIQSFLSI